jgi:hypothetical protein
MMANPTSLSNVTEINVKTVDNEFYIIASTPSMTSELLHVSNGVIPTVSYIVNPAHVLPGGTYSLTFVGINWGGPWGFSVTITSSSGTFTYGNSSNAATVGVVWSETLTITVG